MTEILGLVLASAALLVALLAWREARRSADSAESSAASSRRSAAEAVRLSTVEVERRHDELRPVFPEVLALHTKVSRLPDRWEVFGSITVDRDYRVAGAFQQHQGHSSLNLPALLRAGQTTEFHLGTVGYGDPLLVERVRVQFWPPSEVDGVDTWLCPCDRPDAAEQPHWEATARVEFSPIRPAAPEHPATGHVTGE